MKSRTFTFFFNVDVALTHSVHGRVNGFAIVLFVVDPLVFLKHVGGVDQPNGIIVHKQITFVDHEIAQLRKRRDWQRMINEMERRIK